jgi:nucleotide-binding universal stress UspA family protein
VYTRILVPLENSPFDVAILEHVRGLAKLCGASILLVHVADGWVARNMKTLKLRDSDEIRDDKEYLQRVSAALERDGYDVDAILAGGEPAQEIIEVAQREGCDLIAMSTHGHRFFSDLLYGSVAESVRHRCTIPVLLVRGSAEAGSAGASES